MTDHIKRLSEVLRPDAGRTVLRPFIIEDPSTTGSPRTGRVVDRILALSAAELRDGLRQVATGLQDRHPDVDATLQRRYEELSELWTGRAVATSDQRKLIAAYLIEEFSFESVALFNPSVVRHPNQSGLDAGDTRILVSLRGIGEGHISSLLFRTGVWTAGGAVIMDQSGKFAFGPRVDRSEGGEGELLVTLSSDHEISETVIYPFTPSQGRGIEDARLVEFTGEDGLRDYRGTFTAFNGSEVRQGLLRTDDFKTFDALGVRGDLYRGKGMALFPRKIDGRFMMLGRQDNENIWLLASDRFDTWNGGEKILSPEASWEFIQIGNCGSPIEIDEGWLVLTHGVGAVRTYCIGACLLDRARPSKVLARTSKPLLAPEGASRDGYVPNVVYSCGALVRNRTLLLPYGVDDNYAAFASVTIDELLQLMS